MEIVNGAEITYLYANGQPFAYHKKSGEDKTINYLHLDYQGSIMAVTTQSGTIKEEHNYDVWGRPRTASTLAYVLPNPFGSGSDIRRGYTFHEHLEEFNLINMNGRMYDPLLARFLNADPLIQDNTDAQNYNRYSYVLNNPTKYTDPSGYAYNGFAASNAAYERMLEQYSYDMVMQREMDFLSFMDMVKMNENFGGGPSANDGSSSGSPTDGGDGKPVVYGFRSGVGSQERSILLVNLVVRFNKKYGIPDFSHKWTIGTTAAMQASNGDASPYHQNQGKYTGRDDANPMIGMAANTGGAIAGIFENSAVRTSLDFAGKNFGVTRQFVKAATTMGKVGLGFNIAGNVVSLYNVANTGILKGSDIVGVAATAVSVFGMMAFGAAASPILAPIGLAIGITQILGQSYFDQYQVRLFNTYERR